MHKVSDLYFYNLINLTCINNIFRKCDKRKIENNF